MSMPILIIDPGHGGKDPGAGSNQYFKEKEMNLKISLYQMRRFKELGVNVAITRAEDIYLSPTERIRIVRESGARYCISNHLNAANIEVRGVETIHSIYANGELAQVLYQAVVDEGMKPRRVFSKENSNYVGKDYYFMHSDTGAVKTVIVEYGFATNADDTKLLIDNWERYAEAVVRAFCRYINHRYLPPESRIKQPIKDNDLAVSRGGKLMPDKLKSRKFWVTVVSAVLVVLNEGLGMNIDSEAVLGFSGIIISYLLGQSYIDSKEATKKD